MDKVFNNPYRVLGLVSPITSKELAKRTNDLETFIEFGKAKNYPLDMSASHKLIRTVESIQDAARDLEGDTDKVFNSLFWFYKYDSVDEIAFEAIKIGSYEKAFNLWESQILSSTDPKFSWLINSNVLSLFDMETSGFNYDKFYTVIERYSSVINDLEKIKLSVLQSSKNTVDNLVIGQKLIDRLFEYVISKDEEFLKGNSFELFSAFANYDDELENYGKSKIINPYIKEIENIINEVKQGVDKETSWAIYSLVDLLKEKESLIRELDLFCNDYKVQRLVNDYAEVAMQCSIFANNELEETDFAKEIIDWADELPAYGETKSSITDNKAKLETIIEEKSLLESFSNVFEYLKQDIYSIADSERLLNNMVMELKSIKVDSVKKVELFRDLAKTCAFKIINKVFDIYKIGFEEFEVQKDIKKLNTNIDKCYNLMAKVKLEFMQIDIDHEVRQDISEAYNTISSERATIKKALNQKNNQVYLPVVVTNDKPVIGGALYAISNITGINSTYLRIGYVIATIFTGFWPLIVVYAVLTIIKSFIENNAK